MPPFKRSGWVKFAPGSVVTWGSGFARARVLDLRLGSSAGADEFLIEFLNEIPGEDGHPPWKSGTQVWIQAANLRSLN